MIFTVNKKEEAFFVFQLQVSVIKRFNVYESDLFLNTVRRALSCSLSSLRLSKIMPDRTAIC